MRRDPPPQRGCAASGSVTVLATHWGGAVGRKRYGRNPFARDGPLSSPVTSNMEIAIVPKYIIERNIPGASDLTAEQLQAIAARSNAVVAGLGEPYTWHLSYVAGDKFYCIHEPESAGAVNRHAEKGDFPPTR